MIILDTLLVGGIKFVLGKLVAAVEAELNDDSVYREELLAAQMKLELGEISEEDFAELERAIVTRIREIREARGETGPIADLGSAKVTGVEASVYEGEEEASEEA